MKRPKISFQPLATLYPLEEKIRTGGLGPCTGGDRQLQGPCCVSSIKAISQQPRPGAARNRNQNENYPKLEKGVFLTWEDLWVSVVSKAKNENGSRSRSILQGVTGYARPGELLAIMGPSGCGKSTLLDALGGRLSSNARKTGKILINGQKQALAYGTSAYVTQDDTLITTLTVSEAVYYSASCNCRTPCPRQRRKRAEITIREMGLQDAMNTRIGGWGSKGLSGGARGESAFALSFLHDQIFSSSTNQQVALDSAASIMS
ncbi:hypothetical protein GBA52_026690 [Prunus armeniaca]|nr:hypothetical protein GBA52_026690 [Prunus armeniaca]